jgi:hypothetical protein
VRRNKELYFVSAYPPKKHGNSQFCVLRSLKKRARTRGQYLPVKENYKNFTGRGAGSDWLCARSQTNSDDQTLCVYKLPFARRLQGMRRWSRGSVSVQLE